MNMLVVQGTQRLAIGRGVFVKVRLVEPGHVGPVLVAEHLDRAGYRLGRSGIDAVDFAMCNLT